MKIDRMASFEDTMKSFDVTTNPFVTIVKLSDVDTVSAATNQG